jgi:predicted glycosyltransferase
VTQTTVLVYCRVWFGAGHWFRIAALMQSLTTRYHVTCVVDGALSPDLGVPAGVDVVLLPALVPGEPDAISSVTQRVEALLGVLDRVRPDILIVEYFPFGRREVTLEMVRLLHAARNAVPSPLIVCSLRDIQQRLRRDQQRFDRDVVTLLHRYFDAVFVHADPQFVRFDETFAEAARLTVPIHHTGYVVPTEPPVSDGPRIPVVVVSAGGGRGGEALLFAAINAQRHTDLSRDLSMRIIAGTLLPEETWQQLQVAAQDCPRLTLLRWVPRLRDELTRAAVSVSRCGYNTSLDLVRSRVPALVVPYATPDEDEQTTRAERLTRAGLARTLPEWLAVDPAHLATAIRETAQFVPHRSTINCDGGPRSLALLDAMLLARAT